MKTKDAQAEHPCAQDQGSECSLSYLWPPPCSLHRAAVTEMLKGAASGYTDPSVTVGGACVQSPWTKRFPGSGVLSPVEWSLGAPILSRQISMILRHLMKSADHPCMTCPALQGQALLRHLAAKAPWSWLKVLVGVFPPKFLYLTGSEEISNFKF